MFCFYNFLNQIIIKLRQFDILEATDAFQAIAKRLFQKGFLSPGYSIEVFKEKWLHYYKVTCR